MDDTKHIQQFIQVMHKVHKIVGPKSIFDLESAVTPLQADALLYLRRHPKSTVGAVGKYLQLSSSAITQLTDRLEKSGFIKRENSPRDRRITILSLTREGKQVFTRLHNARMKKMKALIGAMPEKDAKELIRIYSNFLEKIEGRNKELKTKLRQSHF